MRRMCLLSAFLVWSQALPLHAEPAPEQLMLILDASGSMKAKLGGKPKIDIAKAVSVELLRKLPEGVRVGLTAYGHRRKKDCADVEQLAPIAPLDRAALTARVHALKPLGMTPITRSVDEVARHLPSEAAAHTTILLVSDGEETCDADPCARVKQLRASGLRFTMHVVGFGVKAQERKQLECIATEGGGQYFDADSAAALVTAFDRALDRPAFESGIVALVARRQGKAIRAEYRIVGTGGTAVAARGYTSEAGPLEVHVAPGSHSVHVEDRGVSPAQTAALAGIVVEAGRSTPAELELAGFGKLSLTARRAGALRRVEYSVVRAAGGAAAAGWTSEAGPVELKLQAGTYAVRVRDGSVHPYDTPAVDGVVVSADGSTPVLVELSPVGTLRLTATRGGGPVRVEYAVLIPTGGRAASGYTSAQGPLELAVLAGTYDVNVRYELGGRTKDEKRRGVLVKAGELTEVVLAAE